jgi:hypothetical protein
MNGLWTITDELMVTFFMALPKRFLRLFQAIMM